MDLLRWLILILVWTLWRYDRSPKSSWTRVPREEDERFSSSGKSLIFPLVPREGEDPLTYSQITDLWIRIRASMTYVRGSRSHKNGPRRELTHTEGKNSFGTEG